MVSPCKKKKTERKGREQPETNSCKNLSERKSKSAKPLTDKKFYLDIKNHTSFKKLEDKLKSLGASLELFLVRDVDYVVTDRADFPRLKSASATRPSPSYNAVSPFCSVSPAATDSPTDGLVSKRTRSRAEAMLERLKQEPQRSSGDVLDNALTWRIPIYPLPKFIDWLEKVRRKAERVENGVRELRGSFLKIETGGRPELRVFRAWPGLDSGVFPGPHRSNARMTRKIGKVTRDVSTGGGSGYCEVCRVHYAQLDEHVNSTQHLKLVSDPAQYSQLDSIIATHSLGGGSRKSLRIAKSPPPVLEMGGKQSSGGVVVNGHVTRSCRGTTPQHQQQGVVSPVCNGSPPLKQHQPQQRALRSRRRVARKRLSAEEKLIEDNKAYYKVEVLNSKLRSTGYMIAQRQVETCRARSPPVKEKEPVVVRFRKVRKTQLAVLSHEAESFMFPSRGRGSVEEEEEEEEEQEGEEEEEEEEEQEEEHQEEVEQQPPPPPPPPPPVKVKEEVEDEEEGKLERLTFSFERTPRLPWIETYHRFDTGQQIYFPRCHDYPKVVLPFEDPRPRRGPGSCSRRRGGVAAELLDDRPRKSPRCHASTLAIMSSLTRRRGRSSSGLLPPVVYDEETRSDWSAWGDGEDERRGGGGGTGGEESGGGGGGGWCAVEDDQVAIALGRGDHILPGHMPCLPVDPAAEHEASWIRAPPGLDSTLSHLVSTYQSCGVMDRPDLPLITSLDAIRSVFDSCNSSDCSDVFGFLEDGRVVSGRRKKRKKRNLTGWPQGKPKKKCAPVPVPAVASTVTSATTPVVKRRPGRPPKRLRDNDPPA